MDIDALKESKRHFNFKFAPNSDTGFAFTSIDSEFLGKVYPFPEDSVIKPHEVPETLSNVDSIYYEYLKELFEVYYNLDNYKYPVNMEEIGLKNSNVLAKKNQDRILYESMDSMINSLELMINKKIDVLDNMRANGMDFDSEKEYNKIYDFKDYFNVVNLIKSVYFSNNLIFSKTLSTWVNKSDPSYFIPSEALEKLFRSDEPYKDDMFFGYLNQLLVRGLFTQALNVLTNCKYQTLRAQNEDLHNLFEILIKLIVDYRIIFNGGDISDDITDEIKYFDNHKDTYKKMMVLFRNFKRDALEYLSSINMLLPTLDDNSLKITAMLLKDTFALLSGSKNSIFKFSNSWFEALNGLVLFDMPNLELINEYLDQIEKSGLEKLEINYSNVWELICFGLIKNNSFLLTIRSLEKLNSESTSYFSVLIDAKGYLKDYNRIDYINKKLEEQVDDDFINDSNMFEVDTILNSYEDELTICQYLLFNHAMNCFSNKKLVPIGVGVLKSLNLKNFKQILTDYLPYNYYCENNDDSEWLIGLCAENKLIELSNNLYKLIGINFYKNSCYLESLENLNKAGDFNWINKIIWKLFEDKLIAHYHETDATYQDLTVIDLLILDEDEINESEINNQLTETQRKQLSEVRLNPILKRFLAPQSMLLKYLNNESNNVFNLSKVYLIKLITFNYLPKKFLSIFYLFLLKYFYLNFTSVNSFNIGISLFETQELIEIIKSLNKFEEKLDTRIENYYIDFLNNEKTQSLKSHYESLQISVPETVADLVKQLREKVSMEIARKYLE